MKYNKYGAAKRVAKNTGFLYARIAINFVIALYSTRLILDALGVEDFGIYNLVAGAVAMLNFLNSAMAESTQRFISFSLGEGDINKRNAIFNISVVLHFIIAIIVVIILEVAGYFLFNGILVISEERIKVAKWVYQFMIVSTFFTIIKVPFDAVLTAHENMLLIAILGIFHSFLKLGIAIYITYSTYDKLLVYGLLIALLTVLLIIISYAYCSVKYKEVEFNLTKQFDQKLFKEMSTFASWSLLLHAAYIITMQSTTIVLNSFFGVVINAAQGISNQVSNQLKNISSTMQRALNPVIVKKEGEKSRRKMLEVSMFGNKFSFFLITFFSVPILIEMPFVLDIWLKDIPEYTVIFCRLQLLRLILIAPTQSFYISIGAIGKVKQDAIWESLLFISVIPLSILLYKFGASPEIIYINLILLTIGISIVRVYFLNRLGGLSVRVFILNVVIRCFGVYIITLLISSVPLLYQEQGLLRLFLVLLISTITFSFTVFLFGFNIVEKNQIKGVLLSFLNKGLYKFIK